MKNIRKIKIKIAQLKCDRLCQRMAKYTETPNFFIEATKEFGYSVNLPVYKRKNDYYLLGFFDTANALNELAHSDEDEVLVDVIDLEEKDVIAFLLSYQYQQHKEQRALAELMIICDEFVAKPEGKAWVTKITQSRNKEVQFMKLFGLNRYAAKCYRKLIQPGNEEYLKMLQDKENGGLTNAYNKCCQDEKKPNEPVKSDQESEPAEYNPPSEESTSEPQPNAEGTAPDEQQQSSQGGPEQPESVPVPTNPKIDGAENDEFMGRLEIYRNQHRNNNQVEHDFVKKVILLLADDSSLEISGKTDLLVNGLSIRNADQLRKNSDGKWKLPDFYEPISVIVYPIVNASDINSEPTMGAA